MPRYRFQSMRALRSDPTLQLGRDYEFALIRRESPVAIIAPHGGKIEEGTSEIAAAIAEPGGYNLFCFAGKMDRHNMHNLHVRSQQYENRQTLLDVSESCFTMISKCDVVVAIHGAANTDDPPQRPREGYDRTIYIGGLHEQLKIEIFKQLAAIRSQLWTSKSPGREARLFYIADNNNSEVDRIKRAIDCAFTQGTVDVVKRSGSTPEGKAFGDFGGQDQNNICNLGAAGAGIQLEISNRLRRELVPKPGQNPPAFFVRAIQAAIQSVQTGARPVSRPSP